MQHNNLCTLSKGVIAKIHNSKSPQEAFNVFKKEIDEQDIINLLNKYDYYLDSRGEIHSVHVTEGEINTHGKGWMIVEYDVEYFSGCKDFDKMEEQYMNVDISIDFSTMEITLTGDDEIKREPDDY